MMQSGLSLCSYMTKGSLEDSRRITRRRRSELCSQSNVQANSWHKNIGAKWNLCCRDANSCGR